MNSYSITPEESVFSVGIFVAWGSTQEFLTDTKSKIYKIFPKFAFVKLLSADSIIDYGYQRPWKIDLEVAIKNKLSVTYVQL